MTVITFERLTMTDRQFFIDCRKESRLKISGGRGIGHNVFHLITITIYEETQNIGLSESNLGRLYQTLSYYIELS